jgi:hypothetical protein
LLKLMLKMKIARKEKREVKLHFDNFILLQTLAWVCLYLISIISLVVYKVVKRQNRDTTECTLRVKRGKEKHN